MGEMHLPNNLFFSFSLFSIAEGKKIPVRNGKKTDIDSKMHEMLEVTSRMPNLSLGVDSM